MNEKIEDDQFAGAVAMIVHDDETVLFESFGMRDKEANDTMPVDAIFRLASMTKPITSVALMMLVEQGQISLTDRVSKYLPELSDLKVLSPSTQDTDSDDFDLVDAQKKMTIYDLLRHTSGFGYTLSRSSPVDRMYLEHNVLDNDSTLAEFVTKISTLPLKHQPGTTFDYSISIDVLARVVETVSGSPIDVFFKKQIFEPLGMIDTAYFVPESKLDRLATAYYPNRDEKIVRDERTNAIDVTKPPAFLAGGHGLFSTAQDYARFCQMLLNGGELDGVRLLAPSTVKLMLSDHLANISGEKNSRHLPKGLGFGFGFAVRLDQGNYPMVGSQGECYWAGALGTGFWISPEDDLIGIFMIQNRWQLKYQNEYRTLVYQALIE